MMSLVCPAVAPRACARLLRAHILIPCHDAVLIPLEYSRTAKPQLTIRLNRPSRILGLVSGFRRPAGPFRDLVSKTGTQPSTKRGGLQCVA